MTPPQTVIEQPRADGGAPARKTRPALLRRPRALAAAIAVAVGLIVAGVLVLSGGEDAPELEPGVPTEASFDEIRSFASSEGRAVYWAGPAPGLKLELTDTSNGNVFVRYLPPDVPIGDRRPAYTTVGTYPMEGAYDVLTRAAKRKGATRRDLPGGGLAIWYRSLPQSVYVAFPGSPSMVEVYSQDGREARRLALSGSVVSVR